MIYDACVHWRRFQYRSDGERVPCDSSSRPTGSYSRRFTFYCTKPLGTTGSPSFINGVIEIETEVAALDLKYGLLRPIEKKLGRQRSSDRNAPRTIDLDLLVYGQHSVHSQELVLPAPEIADRSFVAIPLCELAPDLIPPGFGRTVREIANLFDVGQIEPLHDFTEAIRKDILDE